VAGKLPMESTTVRSLVLKWPFLEAKFMRGQSLESTSNLCPKASEPKIEAHLMRDSSDKVDASFDVNLVLIT